MSKSVSLPIQSATARELPQLARVLAESLFDDPLQQWLFPNAKRRLATSEWMFRRLLRPKISHDLVRVIRDANARIASVAVWTPPYPPAPTRWEHSCESFFMRWVYGKRIHEVRDGFTALATRHPSAPYWYLQALATMPAERSKGHAKRLLEEKFRESESNGVMIALETSNPTNLAYYQKTGFQIQDELKLIDSLPVWLMCRSAGIAKNF
jgi:ribosomal protein S18 acetylase RimI-like enzyme